MKLEPIQGRYTGVTSEEYHAMKSCKGSAGIEHTPISKSMLTTFVKDPEAWRRGIEFRTTRSMDMGSLVDALCLEPEVFVSKFVVAPKTYIVEAGKDKGSKKPWNGNAAVCKKWNAEQEKEGKTVVTAKMLQDAEYARDNLMNNPFTEEIIRTSDTQVAYVTEYQGLVSKSLFDMCPPRDGNWGDTIIDMKRTIGFTPQEFKYEIFKYKYHWQAAMYLDAHNQVTGEDRDRFLFVLSNSTSPFNAGLIEIGPKMIELGREEYRKARALYVSCVKGNRFPSPYAKGPKFIDID